MKKILIYSLVAFLLTTNFTYAAVTTGSDYKLLTPLPCIEGTGNGCTVGQPITKINLDTYIQYVFKISIALAVFLAIIMIIWGGFEYMTSEVPFIKGNARDRITNAIVGLLCVLVSYLVLLTIDPRLVQINSKIDPVCPPGNILKDSICNPADMVAFYNTLKTDLSNLTVDTQTQVNNIEKQLASTQKQKDDLIKKCNASEFEMEYCATNLEKLDQDMIAKKNQLYKLVTNEIGYVQFNNALGIISDNKNYTETATLGDKSGNSYFIKNGALSSELVSNLQNAKDTITSRYNDSIGKVGNTDPATTQLLTKQRDFYLNEISKQADITSTVIRYKNTSGSSNGGDLQYRALEKPYLEEKLAQYQDELSNPKLGTDVGLEDQYKKLLSQRIDMITGALNSK